MTAGPTPRAAAPSRRRWPSRCSTTARPPFVELYARVLGKPARRSSRPRTTCSCSPPAARARWSPPSPTSCAPGTPVLACAAGKFGERWIELGEAYGADVVRYEPGWGARLDPAEIDRLLGENPDDRGRLRHAVARPRPASCTTSRRSPRSRKRHDAILVVDAVSGLGAAELRQDEWGIDVVVAGSQKALMCPPGLGFASRLPARARLRRRAARAAATTSTGARPPRPSARTRRTARSRPPVTAVRRRSTSRST